MDFFASLEKYQKPNRFEAGAEMHYFLDNAIDLNVFPQFQGLFRATKPFDVMRANIILRGIANKGRIEAAINKARKVEGKAIETMEEMVFPYLETLPYLKLGKERIFVPYFPRSVNRLYDGEFEKFQERPYSSLLEGYGESMAIDPFDEYGYRLYDSYFTPLILVEKNEKEAVFFDYDSASLYCVGASGRLHARIALFDRYIRRPYKNHMLERLLPVARAYLNGDREKMIDELVENGLISRRLIFKIFADERKVFDKIFRK